MRYRIIAGDGGDRRYAVPDDGAPLGIAWMRFPDRGEELLDKPTADTAATRLAAYGHPCLVEQVGEDEVAG